MVWTKRKINISFMHFSNFNVAFNEWRN